MENNQENNEKASPLKIFTFNEAYMPPIYKYEKKGEYKYISFGETNQYPLFLLELYNNVGSPLHKAIINKKTKMTAGFGFKKPRDPKLQQFLEKQNLERKILYWSKDFEIYNGHCIEVIWSNDGTSFDMNYLPIHSIRIGLKENDDDVNYYWYSPDWADIKKPENEPQYIREFDPNVRTGRQLIYYIEPNPAYTHLYPIPNYSTCINYIDLDYQIGVFHLNQVRQGFAPSFILNFASGIPTIDEQNQFYREFQRNFKGAGGSGKILLTYSDGKDGAPELVPIQLNNSDERFVMLQDMVEKNITQAHEMPVQLVSFQPGKLGSSEERKELMAEFQTYYIAIRQNQLEESINSLLKHIGFQEKLVLNDYTSADKSGSLVEEPIQVGESRVDNGDDILDASNNII